MANIPSQELPSVAPSGPSGAPGTYFTQKAEAGSFGGFTADAASKFGEDAGKTALAAEAIKNEADFNKATNQAQGVLDAYLNGRSPGTNGPTDPGVKGYKSLLGEDAVNARDQYKQKISEEISNIRANLSPSEQRMFDAQGIKLQRMAALDIGNHYDQQLIVYNQTQSSAKADLAFRSALQNAGDPNDPVAESKWMDSVNNYVAALDNENQIHGVGSWVYHNDKDGNPIPPTDAARLRVDQGLSNLYASRVKQILTGQGGVAPDPIKAGAYLNSHIGMISNPQQRQELSQILGTATDAQYLRGDAQDGFNQLIGQTSNNSPLPAKIEGATIPTFDQAKINKIASYVKGPTPYDADIEAAAKAYNVSPSEIKLKIAIESGGDPKAVNPTVLKGGDQATGLGQFTAATAAQYGITDRTDPTQSIYGIAKMLAANGGTVGNDMSAADRAYIGKGKDADQYVENTRAARQALYGNQAADPMTIEKLESVEGNIPAIAQSLAAQRGRGNDQVYVQRQALEIHSLWAQQMDALRNQDRANYSQILQASSGQTPVKTLSDLPPNLQAVYAKLSPTMAKSIQDMWKGNQNQDPPVTAENTNKYFALMGRAINDPIGFKSSNVAEDIQDLPHRYRDAIVNAYIANDKDQARRDGQDMNWQRAASDVESMLRPIGMGRTAKPNTPQAQDTDAFYGKLQKAMEDYHDQNNNRWPDTPTTQKIAATLLTPGKQDSGHWYSGDSDARVFQSKDLKGFYVPVPSDQKQQLSSTFSRVMGHTPTDAELQSWYTRYQLANGGE